MKARINWFGLAGGIATIAVIIVSLFYPWWQLTVGDNLFKANASPLSTNFDVLGTALTVPLIWALNVASLLTLMASSITMLVYSLVPAKSYSKQLLDFSYKKPLYALLSFVVVLFVLTLLVRILLNFDVPLAGSATITLPMSFVQGAAISVFISTGFQWPFWLAAVAAGLCVAAKFYHKRVALIQKENVTLIAAPLIAPSATAESTTQG